MPGRVVSLFWRHASASRSPLFKTLQLQQRRTLTSYIERVAPDVGAIYRKLVEHPRKLDSTAPMTCNFVSQVVDLWAQKIQRK